MEKLLGENLLVGARVCVEKKAQSPLECFKALGHEIPAPEGNSRRFWEARMRRRTKRINGEEVLEEDKKEVLSEDEECEGGEEETGQGLLEVEEKEGTGEPIE